RHLEILPVILSEAKDLALRTERSFASLRMTGRTSLKFAHGKSSLQMSVLISTSTSPSRHEKSLVSGRRCIPLFLRLTKRLKEEATREKVHPRQAPPPHLLLWLLGSAPFSASTAQGLEGWLP